MKENFEKSERKLSSGVEVLFVDIDETDDEVIFTVALDREVSMMNDLSDLWLPDSGNDLILQKLKEKTWISPDNTVLTHFKMNVKKSSDEKEWVFRYYKAISGSETVQ